MSRLGSRFWRLYAGSATSNMADGIGRTALPLLAASYTRSPVAISAIMTFLLLPWLLFALPSGAYIDRIDRRYAMAGANALRAVAIGLLGILALTRQAGIEIVYVIAFALGTAETMYDSAIRAIVPQLVDADQLDKANSLLTVEETLGQTLLGSPVGSVLFSVAIAAPFLLNSAGFAVAAVLVLTLSGRYRPARSGPVTSVRRDVADGVRWLLGHQFLRRLTMISAITCLAQTMSNAVLVLYVLEVLRLPSGDFGFVLLLAGVGGLIGGLATPPLARAFGRGPMLVAGGLVAAAATGSMALTRNGYVAAALFGVGMAGVLVWNVLTMSLRQALIPHELFGRVQGAYRTVVWGAIPLGSLLGGLAASAFGLRVVFAISGGGMLATAVALAWLARVHADVFDRGPAPEPAAPATDVIASEGSAR